MKKPGLKSEVSDCLEEYKKTLAFFGIRRGIRLFDETAIARAIVQHGGDAEFVKLAIMGARVEKPNEKYNPAEYCSLGRILDPKKIERFANLGAMTEEHQEIEPIKIPGREE